MRGFTDVVVSGIPTNPIFLYILHAVFNENVVE